MKIIISGATGTIGMALIQRELEEQNDIWIICHKNSKRIQQIPQDPKIRILEYDLDEYTQLTKEKIGISENDQIDVFFHFAWEGTTGASRNDMPLQISNIRHTMDAVELANRLGCHTFIGAGSQAEYGRVEGLLTADTPAFPENGYGMAKLCAGQMSRQRCEELGMRHIWTRILSVYGPYDGDGSLVMSTLHKLMAGQRASCTKGEQQWDYLYSEDAAEAMHRLAIHGKAGKIYVLGSGSVHPLREYIEKMRDAVSEVMTKSGEVGLGDIPYAPKQVMYLGADISELVQDTGFSPKFSFDEGIRKTIDSKG